MPLVEQTAWQSACASIPASPCIIHTGLKAVEVKTKSFPVCKEQQNNQPYMVLIHGIFLFKHYIYEMQRNCFL